MKYFLLLCSFVLGMYSLPTFAQENDDELYINFDEENDEENGDKNIKTEIEEDEEDDLGIDENKVVETPRPQSNFRKGEMAPLVASRIKKAAAIENLMHPEQVFCYRVDNMPEGYTGYTLDGFALMSYCGVLNKNAIDTIIEQFFSREENISTNVENCKVKPQIILRFVRGVDSTDVLLSSPCHSYTTFYATDRQTFNLSPIARSVDYLIGTFNNVATEFVSPAILGQLAASGVAQNDEQKALIENTKGPMRLWEQRKTQENQKKTGWNKLKK